MEGNVSGKYLAVLELLAGLAAGVLIVLVRLIFVPRTWIWYVLLWLIGLLFVLSAFLYLPLFHLSCRYVLTDAYLEFLSGVLFASRRRMRRDAILYVTAVRSPFSRLLGTGTLLIRAMGGSMILPMLPKEDAQALLAALGEEAL